MPYRLELLGRVQLLHDGRPVDSFAGHRQRLALLAYLALQPDLSASRDRLVGLFWPDRDETSARHSLSELLYEIRRETADLVEGTRASVGLVADGFRCDAREFRDAVEAGDVERAERLYAGNFLEGMSLSITSDFEHWAESERSQLQRLHRKVCRELVASLRERGDVETAIAFVRRWLATDPFEDEANHCLIELLASGGDRSGALDQFDRYSKMCRELEVQPLEETVTLVEAIRSGDFTEHRSAVPSKPEAEAARRLQIPGGEPEAAGGVASPAVTSAPTQAARLPERPSLARLHRWGLPGTLHVLILYGALAWAAVGVGKRLVERQAIPWWILPTLYSVLAVGFPLAMLLTWVGKHRRVGAAARQWTAHGRWPRWAQGTRSGHVRAFLGTLVLVFLSWLFLLERGRTDAASSVAAVPDLPPTRIAVLYFDDHSPGRDLEYLAAGLTDNLIHELRQVSALEVISRSGVKPFKDAGITLDSIARALGAGTLVEGSVTRSTDLLSVTVRLVESRGLTQLESRVLERPWGEHLAMRNALAEEVAEILRRRLGVEIELRRRRAETQSDQAWALVRRAENVQEDAEEAQALKDTVATARLLDEADALLAGAEALDEDWVEPIVLRGWVAYDRATSAQGATPRVPAKLWLARAIVHANRALERDSKNAAALELRGKMRYHLREQSDSAEAADLLELAESDLREAVAIDPSRALAWITLSDLLRVTTRFVEANTAAKRAWEADPFLWQHELVIYNLYGTLMELEDLSGANYWCEEARRKYAQSHWVWTCGIFLMALPGGPQPDIERAWEYFASFERLTPPAQREFAFPIARMYLAAIHARAGLADSARALMFAARSEADAAGTVDPQGRILYYEAYVRLLLGERDSALVLLQEYLRINPHRRGYIAQDWLWRDLRDDPRFQAMTGATS